MHPLIEQFLNVYPIHIWFKDWDPQLTGSYLMGLEIDSSDIDFSFLIEDLPEFVHQIQRHLGEVKVIYHEQYVECIKQFEGKTFSLFAPKKISEILAIRQHYRELSAFVETLNDEQKNVIKTFKREGLKTPQAIQKFKNIKKVVDK